jgi:hypothetical protein
LLALQEYLPRTDGKTQKFSFAIRERLSFFRGVRKRVDKIARLTCRAGSKTCGQTI